MTRLDDPTFDRGSTRLPPRAHDATSMRVDSPVLPVTRGIAWINRAAALLSLGYLAAITRYYFLDRDFAVYYHAARALRSGSSPYDLPGHVYLYGPLFAKLLEPLVLLDLAHARFVWFVSQCVALIGFVLICIAESGSRLAHRWWGVVLLCTVMARPTHDDLTLGQIGIFIAFLLVASFSISRRHTVLGGFLLSLATVIKSSPVFLYVMLLCERRWSLFRWTIASTVLLIILTLGICGVEVHVDFIRKLGSGAGYPILAEHNDSIYPLWLRLFTANRFVRPVMDTPLLAASLIAISIFGVIAACLYLTGPCRDQTSRVSVFGLWLGAMVLLFPASGLYSLVILLLPLLVILHEIEEDPRPGLLTAFIVAVGLLYVPPMNALVGTEQLESPWMALCFAPPVFAVMLTFLLSAVIARRRIGIAARRGAT